MAITPVNPGTEQNPTTWGVEAETINDNLQFLDPDTAPIQNGTKPVTSGALFTGLSGKVNVNGSKQLSDENYTTTEKTKLGGIATGATANATDAQLRDRATHTGTQSADSITDGTTNKAYTATEKTKLAGVATGATAYTDALALAANATKVNRTDFTQLTFSANIAWDCANEQSPFSKVTATGNYNLNISNLKSGAIATHKLTTNTAAGITVSFAGTGLTFKINGITVTSYSYSAGTGKDYYLQFINDNGIVEVLINDPSATSASSGLYGEVAIAKETSQTIVSNTVTVLTFDTTDVANLDIYNSTTSTSRFYNPSTTTRKVKANTFVQWAGIATPDTAAGFFRMTFISINGAEPLRQKRDRRAAVPTANQATFMTSSFEFYLPAGAYFEVNVIHNQQTSGGAALSVPVSKANVLVELR